jgi:hypothetical protein
MSPFFFYILSTYMDSHYRYYRVIILGFVSLETQWQQETQSFLDKFKKHLMLSKIVYLMI